MSKYERALTRKRLGPIVVFMTRTPKADKTPARVVGYVRVSTSEQASEGYSLAAQRERLTAYANLYGLTLVGIVEEQASAKDLKRPQLQDVLGRLARGEADGLLIAKLDRLTRSVKDLGELIERHFVEGKASLLSVAENIDTRSASGRLVLNVLGSVAQWERETISERTAQAKAEMRAQGVFQGGAIPFGWRVNADRTLTAIPEEQATIARAHELKSQGLVLRAIASRLASEKRFARNGKPFAAQQVANMLKASEGEPVAQVRGPKDLVLEAIRLLAPKHRRMVPIWDLRAHLDMGKELLDETLLKLSEEQSIFFKTANDPTLPEVLDHGGPQAGIDQRAVFSLAAGKRVGFDGRLLWFVVLND